MVGPWGVLIVLTFSLFYLLPIAYVGSFKKDVRFMPVYLKHIQRVACLFTHSVGSWKSYHVQFQRTGSEKWEELEQLDAFTLNIFGYRNRIHRICGHAFKKSRGRRRTKELAGYIKTKLEIGEGPTRAPVKIDAIRFVRAWHPVKDLAEEEGRYSKPRLDDVPRKRWQIFGENRWDGERVMNP